MSRQVKLRVSFQADIGFLSRLAQAVERDEYMVPAEKREAIQALAAVQQVFHRVETRRLEERAGLQHLRGRVKGVDEETDEPELVIDKASKPHRSFGV